MFCFHNELFVFISDGPENDADDILGPVETPFPSLRFRRNFTFPARIFNDPGDPFHLYPYTPFEPVLPAEAKFLGKYPNFSKLGVGVLLPNIVSCKEMPQCLETNCRPKMHWLPCSVIITCSA